MLAAIIGICIAMILTPVALAIYTATHPLPDDSAGEDIARETARITRTYLL